MYVSTVHFHLTSCKFLSQRSSYVLWLRHSSSKISGINASRISTNSNSISSSGSNTVNGSGNKKHVIILGQFETFELL